MLQIMKFQNFKTNKNNFVTNQIKIKLQIKIKPQSRKARKEFYMP
jgi:hypothetical protein